MNASISTYLFQAVLTILLFSLWAGFALLVVNPLFHKDLPGYVIGRICIWEGVAILIAGLIAYRIIKSWGSIEWKIIDNQARMVLHPNYGIFFFCYFLLAVVVGIWQFWLFSLKF